MNHERKPNEPLPESNRDKPGLHFIKNKNDPNKTIFETPHFLFHIETSYDFDSEIWTSGGYEIPTEAWRTKPNDTIQFSKGQKGS